MSNRRSHSTGKGNSAPYRLSKVTPRAVFGKIILAGGSGIFPKNPALPGCGPFGACGIKSPVPHQ
ncbi:MAG: hypothetical protein HUK10_14055 [Bacteroides heparinolyticus]|nr:hypothetical protein [Bacteroides heparinolyticus]